MTDSQFKYQTLMENQRHNLAMEQIGRAEAQTKAAAQDLAVTKHQWDVTLADYEKPAERAKNIASAFQAFGTGFMNVIKGVTGAASLFS